MRLSPRAVFGGIALFCIGLLAAGLYLQHVKQLEPCPLCILQRYGYVSIAVLALAAFVHNPRGLGRAVYAGLITLAALAGGGVALRQIWLIRHPTLAMTCGGSLEYYLETFPLSKALPSIFRGAGDCTADTWQMLGLRIPEWSLLGFALVAVAGVFMIFAGISYWQTFRYRASLINPK